MKKTDVINFFDALAADWDQEAQKDPKKIQKILDVAQVGAQSTVLDVGCGTGILIPDYLERQVKQCIAVDISPNMIAIAKDKFKECEQVRFLCEDAQLLQLTEPVDCVVIYNAFPHFTDAQRLFQNLSRQLVPGGRLTVAHGMSRQALAAHHAGRAEKVSKMLPDVLEMKELMQPYLFVDVTISNDEIYIVSGRKKD